MQRTVQSTKVTDTGKGRALRWAVILHSCIWWLLWVAVGPLAEPRHVDLQMSVTMMAAVLMRHFRFEAIHPNTNAIPCGYDITVGSGADASVHSAECSHTLYIIIFLIAILFSEYVSLLKIAVHRNFH